MNDAKGTDSKETALLSSSYYAVKASTYKTAEQKRNGKNCTIEKMELCRNGKEEIKVDYKPEDEKETGGEVDTMVKNDLDELLGLHVQFGDNQAVPLIFSEECNRLEKKLNSDLVERTPVHIQPVDIGDDAFKMWSHVGLSLGLNSDPEIATFLLQHYENTKNILIPNNQCLVCHQPLSLVCSKCSHPATTQASFTLSRSSQKIQKNSRDLMCQSSSRAGRYPEMVNISFMRRKKRRKIDRRNEKATYTVKKCEPANYNDDEHYLGILSEDENLNKEKEDGACSGDVSANNQLQEVSRKQDIKIESPKDEELEEKVFNCKMCNHSYTRACSLKAYMRKHTGEKPFRCSECKAAFSLSGSLIVHRRAHTGDKPYACEDCGRSFSISSALKQHRRQHTGEKPYQCSICFSKYSRSDSLRVHMRSHSGDRPFICEECGADFSRLYCLIAHKKKHSGERPFQCTECNATFTQSGKLTIHMRKHTGDRPFQCEQCGASFTQSDRLKTHMRIHSGEKPYKCGECGKGFSHPHSLKVHARAHTGDRPYKCDICSLTFADPSYFRRHKTKHSKSSSLSMSKSLCTSVTNTMSGEISQPISSTADVPKSVSSAKAFATPLSLPVSISVPLSSTVISAGFIAAESPVLYTVSHGCFSVTSTGLSSSNPASLPSVGFSVPNSSGLGSLPMPSSSVLSDGVDATNALLAANINPSGSFLFLRSALQCGSSSYSS